MLGRAGGGPSGSPVRDAGLCDGQLRCGMERPAEDMGLEVVTQQRPRKRDVASCAVGGAYSSVLTLNKLKKQILFFAFLC